MNDPNVKFADHATLVAFSLNLSKGMVIGLCAVASGGHRWEYFRALGMRSVEIAAGMALERRGLVFSPDPEWPGRYELSEAGKLVFELLKLAGLVNKVEGSIPQMEKVK